VRGLNPLDYCVVGILLDQKRLVFSLAEMKTHVHALILLLFTSKAYCENITVIFQETVFPSGNKNWTLTLYSDSDPKKNPEQFSQPQFIWRPLQPIEENIQGSSASWPEIMSLFKRRPTGTAIMAYFLSKKYTLTYSIQRSEEYIGQSIQDIWTFSKPDAKK